MLLGERLGIFGCVVPSTPDCSYFYIKLTSSTGLTFKAKTDQITFDNKETDDNVIDWGDGTLEPASKYHGTYIRHTYASYGEYVIKVSGKLVSLKNYAFNSLNTLIGFNVYAESVGRSCFGNNKNMTGEAVYHASQIYGWNVYQYCPSVIDIYGDVILPGGEWVFPVCPNLESIVFHDMAVDDVYALNNFAQITNCMQTSSTSYKNTKAICKDGYIQYDIDTYGREDTPVIGHYKKVYF